MEDFIYKCKKCGTLNVLSPDWFRDAVEKKVHSCKSCDNRVQLNVAKIRAELYNNFKSATELVFGGKIRLDDLYLKITVNEDTKKLQKLESETIIIGRGQELISEIYKDENGKSFQRISIPDKFISSKHCELQFNSKNNKVTIRDLGSLNKTFIENIEIQPDEILILNIGKKINIGTTILEIC